MKNRKVRTVILSLWLLTLLSTTGICLGMYRKKEQRERLRAQTILDMTTRIRSGEKVTFTVDPDAIPVSGEDPLQEDASRSPVSAAALSDPDGTFSDSDPTSHSAADPSSADYSSPANAPDAYTLSSCGVISIPSIDCLLPLWDGAGSIELRYGAGRVPTGAFPGEEGNLVILGHRMKKYGSLFNRLGEVKSGDTISIETESGTFTYLIDTIITIDPSELSFYMQDEGDTFRITLITCTPVGVGTQRLLVLGHLLTA